MKESISVAIAPKAIKFLGINVAEEVKILSSRNDRTMMKEAERTHRKGKTFHARGWEARSETVCHSRSNL